MGRVTEPVSGGGSLILNKSIFNPSFGFSGHLDASSLKLQILDGAGELLYQSLGGVQLTKLLNQVRLVLVSDSSLFADPLRDDVAVDAALQSLAQKSSTGH